MLCMLIYSDTLKDGFKSDPLNQISIKRALMLHSSRRRAKQMFCLHATATDVL